MDSTHPEAVHCPACSRLVKVPDGAQAGSQITCPFCGSALLLKEVPVLMAELVEPGQDST